MKILSSFWVLLFSLHGSLAFAVAASEYDVVIYGGTSSAVIAAVQTSRMNKSVVIVCPDKHLGGLSSSGLGFTDSGNTSAVGGLSRGFYAQVFRHYQQPGAWTWQEKEKFGNRGQGTAAMDGEQKTMWVFEPHVAEQVFERLLAEYRVPVRRNQWLDRERGLEKAGNRIVSIRMRSGESYVGKMFIDATYEGDLMALAGVSYIVGRESNSKYGETLNGVQTANATKHQFPGFVDPYVEPGKPASGLLPRIHSGSPGTEGEGDRRLQAYCFRMCLTDVARNRVAFPKPENYDARQYELLLRVLATGWREAFRKFDRIPNGKTDTNNHGPFSTDNIGMNYDYPEASYERRAEIMKEHETYQKGLMYFMANDPRVPSDVSEKMRLFGLAKDEFVDNGNWPYQLYIREARRMISDFVVTENHLRRKLPTPRPVGMGSYNMDSHNVQRYVDSSGSVRNEGDIQVNPGGPYSIDYGALTPKRSECENLLVPVCLSTSHIAYGSIRMEPVFMILGQSAATAAAIAVEDECAVQDVDYGKLKTRLLADGQILQLP